MPSPMTAPQHPDEGKNSQRATRGLRLEALASGFVALLALLLSAYTVYIQRQQLKVQAWPRLTLEDDAQPGPSPGEIKYTVSVKNRGVAPAEVRAMRVAFDGEDVTDWRDWFAHIKRKHGLDGPRVPFRNGGRRRESSSASGRSSCSSERSLCRRSP